MGLKILIIVFLEPLANYRNEKLKYGSGFEEDDWSPLENSKFHLREAARKRLIELDAVTRTQ
jgi:hypothetical protein